MSRRGVGTLLRAQFQSSLSARLCMAQPPRRPKMVNIAVAQMTSGADREANFSVCERLVKVAVDAQCKMVFFPECFAFLGESSQQSVATAEPLDGLWMTRYRDLARKYGMWLSLGGFQETGPDDNHIYNCHVIVDREGAIAADYRKVHLFNVEVPNGPVLRESGFTTPGSELVTCDSPVGRLGLTVCYDLRFPAVYQRLRFDGGADLLLVPSAFTKPTGEAHWHTLLGARAIENQAYVIAAAQAGVHNSKRESYGHSIVLDPWGKVIAQMSDPSATGIAVAEISLDEIDRVRQRMPIAEHRAAGRSVVEGDIRHFSMRQSTESEELVAPKRLPSAQH